MSSIHADRFSFFPLLHNDNDTILQVLEQGKKTIDELGGKVMAVVGDNHSGLQLGVQKKHTLTTISYCLRSTGIQRFLAKHPGIFGLRCAAHSLQLLMGDLYKHRPLCNALRLGEAILTHFSNVDAKQKLMDIQKAAQVEPLKLISPVATRSHEQMFPALHAVRHRWNSTCDAHERMVKLRPYINAVVVLANSYWDDMCLAVKVMKPLAVATDILQRDKSTVATVKQ